MALVKLEGQDIPLDDALAGDDNLTRKALTPFYAEVANAQIKRETKEGQMIVTVVKRAGPKGTRSTIGSTLAALTAAASHVNPALQLYLEFTNGPTLTAEQLLIQQPQIEAALIEGQAEVEEIQSALQSLFLSRPIPATFTPLGF
jgi:hypothetical protein